MKKIKKILLITFIIFLVLVIGTVVVVGLSLDKIVKKGIETVAPGITQTSVTVDSVNILILSGSAGVHDFVIGNPEGYTSSNAMTVGKAKVVIVPGSIFKDKVVIHSIAMNDPQITFEGNPFGANNLKKLMANVEASAGASQQTNSASKGASRKMQVDDFLLTGAKVHVQINTGILNKQMTLTIPEIHLTNLGSGPDGITAAELMRQVLQQVTSKTLEIVLSEVGNLGKDAGKLGKDAVNGATKNVGDKIGKGIGGLFGK